jgi:shikimate dehydrogenase
VTQPPGSRPRSPGGAWPVASTRLVALLGWPVGHSLSPAMHNAAFADQGLDLVYVACPTPPDDLPAAIAGLGAVGAVGANVTVPHKQAVVDRCDHLTEEAALVGAVNTLVWTTNGLLGDNTDASGLQSVLRDEVGVSAVDRALMLGTGGAARAVAVALGRLGVAVTVVGRRAAAADDVATLAATAGSPDTDALDLDDASWVGAALADSRLVINATPLGMAGEQLPAPFDALSPSHVAYDLVYNPPDTPFLQAARAAGAGTHHGLGMLVAQAGAAFQRWTGHAPPLDVMSAVAMATLAA